VGGAATAIPDRTSPGCDDCFLINAFRWHDGVVDDLRTLSGVNFSHATSINARSWATGGSFTADIDPLTGGQTEHAVLWKGKNHRSWHTRHRSKQCRIVRQK
jgi:uncharacterized membrane protein